MTIPFEALNSFIARLFGTGGFAAAARLRARLSVLAGVVATAIVLAAGSASAGILSGGAGGLTPWSGDGGYSIMGSIGYNPISELTRLALEVEYRSGGTKATVGGKTVKIPVDSYDIRAVFRLVFAPGRFTPYLGFGAGLKVISIDLGALDLTGDFAPGRTYGIAAGLIALAGLEMPLFSEHFAGFVEARADYAWELTDGFDSLVDDKHVGAFTGMAGLRWMF